MTRMSKDAAYDNDLLVKDAGLIAADDVAQVGGADAIIDMGVGRFDGRLIIDATAVEVANGDERYNLELQFSNSATFASAVVNGPGQALGDAATIVGADTDNGAGRYELAFCNEVAGTQYRYARLSIDVAGTIATGVNFTAFIAKPA